MPLVIRPYAMEGGVREGRDPLEEMWDGIQSLFEFETLDVLEITEALRGVLAVVHRSIAAAA